MEEVKDIAVIQPETTEIMIEMDSLTELADVAEKRIDAIKKIRNIVLRITNVNDWVDQGGKPYLQGSGCHKVARVFGITWSFIGDPVKVREEDGHFRYDVKLAMYMKGQCIEVLGSRSSRDPFFNVRWRNNQKITLPASEVDSGDVLKASITNAQANGITTMLGLKNLTWDDLKQGGIEKAGTRVDYKKPSPTPPTGTTPPPQEQQQSLPNPNEPTQKQLDAMNALLNKLGIKDDYERHEKVSTILDHGHVVESLKQISMADASKVIGQLQKEVEKK